MPNVHATLQPARQGVQTAACKALRRGSHVPPLGDTCAPRHTPLCHQRMKPEFYAQIGLCPQHRTCPAGRTPRDLATSDARGRNRPVHTCLPRSPPDLSRSSHDVSRRSSAAISIYQYQVRRHVPGVCRQSDTRSRRETQHCPTASLSATSASKSGTDRPDVRHRGCHPGRTVYTAGRLHSSSPYPQCPVYRIRIPAPRLQALFLSPGPTETCH